MTRIIDISQILSPRLAPWPGDAPFSRDVRASFASGDTCDLSSVHLSLHVGSHTDAPGHTSPGGASIDQVDLSLYFGTCEVLEAQLQPRSRILPEHLLAPIRAPRVLFKTCSHLDRECFTEDFVSLSPELVEHLQLVYNKARQQSITNDLLDIAGGAEALNQAVK